MTSRASSQTFERLSPVSSSIKLVAAASKLYTIPPCACGTGGFFWGVEQVFLKHYPPSQNKGTLKTAVGYTGGNIDDPNYRQVCTGSTNHSEALRIEFDPNVVSYAELVGESAMLLVFHPPDSWSIVC